jgi:hypothetical protein
LRWLVWVRYRAANPEASHGIQWARSPTPTPPARRVGGSRFQVRSPATARPAHDLRALLDINTKLNRITTEDEFTGDYWQPSLDRFLPNKWHW